MRRPPPLLGRARLGVGGLRAAPCRGVPGRPLGRGGPGWPRTGRARRAPPRPAGRRGSRTTAASSPRSLATSKCSGRAAAGWGRAPHRRRPPAPRARPRRPRPRRPGRGGRGVGPFPRLRRRASWPRGSLVAVGVRLLPLAVRGRPAAARRRSRAPRPVSRSRAGLGGLLPHPLGLRMGASRAAAARARAWRWRSTSPPTGSLTASTTLQLAAGSSHSSEWTRSASGSLVFVVSAVTPTTGGCDP